MSLEDIKSDIKAIVAEKDCGPIFIRLSWHDAGVFSTGKLTGGKMDLYWIHNHVITCGRSHPPPLISLSRGDASDDHLCWIRIYLRLFVTLDVAFPVVNYGSGRAPGMDDIVRTSRAMAN